MLIRLHEFAVVAEDSATPLRVDAHAPRLLLGVGEDVVQSAIVEQLVLSADVQLVSLAVRLGQALQMIRQQFLRFFVLFHQVDEVTLVLVILVALHLEVTRRGGA